MGGADGEPAVPVPGPKLLRLTDAHGHATEDPAAAVRGEIVDREREGRHVSFFFAEREIPWLPIGEAAFLLWVLAFLMLLWIGVGVALWLT